MEIGNMKSRFLSKCIGIALLNLILNLPCALAEDEYIYILRSRGNPYWNTVVQGIRESGASHNVKVTVLQGESESSAEEQINICLAAIQRKPVFIAVTAATIGSGIQCLKRASEAGIHVAEMDTTVPLEDAAKAGLKLSFSVGSNNYIVGQKAGEFASSLLGSSDAKVLVLEGDPGIEAGRLRVKGFKDTLLERSPKSHIVASISANWDRLKAMTITSDILQREPDLRLIYAANDLMALGAVEALKAKGKLGTVAVVGVDGISDARRAILAGDMIATVAQLPYLIGKRAVDLAVDVQQGRQVGEREVIETPLLTKSVLEKRELQALQYIR